MPDHRVLPAGDTALVIEFGDRIDRQINARVVSLWRRVKEAVLAGIGEAVPLFRALVVL